MKKKNYKKFTFKTKEEWLIFKENTIGGSEAAAVVSKSKWLSLDDLYNKFVLKKIKKVSTNQRIEDGIKSEPLIAEQFAVDDKRYQIKKQRNPYITYQRVDKPFLTVSPDRLATFIPTGHLVGIEIKDVELIRKEEKENWEIGFLPEQYFYQALHYFVVLTDVQEVVVVAHLNYMKFDETTKTMIHDKSVTKPYLLLRKDMQREIEWLENKETSFWENNVLKRKRPPLILNI